MDFLATLPFSCIESFLYLPSELERSVYLAKNLSFAAKVQVEQLNENVLRY